MEELADLGAALERCARAHGGVRVSSATRAELASEATPAARQARAEAEAATGLFCLGGGPLYAPR